MADIVNCRILIDGKEVPSAEQFEVQEIQITKEINQISGARIKLQSGLGAKLNQGNTYQPGNTIEIQAGFGRPTSTIFRGIIISQMMQAYPNENPSLVIECKDEAVKLTTSCDTDVFLESTDSAAIRKVLGKYNLESNISSTENEYPQIVQYNASDWDFICSRAAVNSMIVWTDNNRLIVEKPKVEGKGVINLSFGNNVVEFSHQLNGQYQYSKVTAKAWNYKEQKLVTGESTQDKTTGKMINPDPFQLLTTAPIPSEMLTTWAEAEQSKFRLTKMQGSIKCNGQANLQPNQLVTLQGFGSSIDGAAFVSGVRHEIGAGTWYTYLEIGLSNDRFSKENSMTTAPASGLLPGIRGILNGVVKQITEDPLSQFRILVTIPIFGDEGEEKSIWARWSQPYATKEAGQFFMPEIGDEVVLGFLNEDPRYPVILGSLYSITQTPPLEPADENPKKTIVSKSKLKIEFDDEDKVLTISTPAGNQVILSEEDAGITILDQNMNKLTLSEEGINMESPSSITISAEESVTISGQAGVTISSEADISINADASLSQSGLEVSISGETALDMIGDEVASITTSGELSINAAVILQDGQLFKNGKKE